MTKNIANQKFGHWTAISYACHDKHGHIMWLCKCDCGTTRLVLYNSLISGKSLSCGCLRIKNCIKASKTHGLTETRLHRIWGNIKTRCLNKNTNCYSYYGGSGITICDEWINDFKKFYDWAIDNGYQENLTIDRKDNTKGYSPDNCRWVNKHIQACNQRLYKNNTTGIKGICKYGDKWKAQIGVNNKVKSLGTYNTIEEAYNARQKYIIIIQ